MWSLGNLCEQCSFVHKVGELSVLQIVSERVEVIADLVHVDRDPMFLMDWNLIFWYTRLSSYFLHIPISVSAHILHLPRTFSYNGIDS